MLRASSSRRHGVWCRTRKGLGSRRLEALRRRTRYGEGYTSRSELLAIQHTLLPICGKGPLQYGKIP